jgi:hypothetical protein
LTSVASGTDTVVRTSDYRLLAGLIMLVLGTLSGAAQTLTLGAPLGDLPSPVCSMIEMTARLNALPVDFFTRLIWRESHLRSDAIGPLTGSGEHAEGIAQFMPGTAAERGLLEPFNPAEALPKSGAFLAELRDEFGNLGLAAAAYNAGPQRLRDFLAGLRDLPLETRRYVLAITGYSVEEWAKQVKAAAGPRAPENSGGSQGSPAPPTCRDVVALLEREPAPAVGLWQGRTFPSWCKGLRHPNVSVCGPVHLIGPSIGNASLTMSRSHVQLFRSSSR